MKITNKVVAYITRADHLLVFTHPEAPEAGIQVPAGSLEPGESPAEGALREAIEETGLTALTLLAPLGETDFDIRPFGREEVHHRYFFHLECTAPTPAIWQHRDPWPSDGGPQPLFEFYWASMPHSVPLLIGGFGDLLPVLYQRLQLKESA